MRRLVFITVVLVVPGWLVGRTGTRAPEMLVEYRRSGGFAGVDDHLVIQENGQATLTRSAQQYQFVLDRDTMNELETFLDNAEFSKLHGQYLPPRRGSDLFEYVIACRGHTVRTVDTAVPEALQPVLELLNHIIESHQKPSTKRHRLQAATGSRLTRDALVVGLAAFGSRAGGPDSGPGWCTLCPPRSQGAAWRNSIESHRVL